MPLIIRAMSATHAELYMGSIHMATIERALLPEGAKVGDEFSLLEMSLGMKPREFFAALEKGLAAPHQSCRCEVSTRSASNI